MESKAADGTRASSKSKEGLWWRWTHGESGSTASSSRVGSRSSHINNSSTSKPAVASPVNGVRWQKRATRTPKEETSCTSTSSSLAWSTSPDAGESCSSTKFFSTTRSTRSSRNAAVSSKKNPTASSLASRGLRDGPSKKSSLGASSLRAPNAGANVFVFSSQQSKPSRGTARGISSFDLSISDKSDQFPPAQTTMFDFDGNFSRCNKSSFQPTSPPAASTASTASTVSSFSSQSFSAVDPLVNCARAVLQDCIRKRKIEQSNARKRSIEDGDLLESKEFGWHYDSNVSKAREYGVMSPGSSSSSDDELSQLSSMDLSFGTEKSSRGCDSKLAKEEMYRQILVGDYDLSSSPEFQCFSPLVEEKGLPIEVRYQLPLALGTANETHKECTICQLRYGIGDHIVTLPCQHFFHACCVDKWLWNHTSCPLCRTEVSLDQKVEAQNTKHNFTECSPVDQERIRRQMRSSSQHAGFRPVVPVEIDQLELEVSRMAIDEDSEVEDEPSYLVCPTPHLATNAQDSCSGN